MKDFIVLTAIVPILMVFVMQFVADYRGLEEVQIIQSVVYTEKETAKEEGGFSEESVASIKAGIADRLGLEPEAVVVTTESEAGSVGRYDNDRNIHYLVRVELPDVMAGASMFGISAADNTRTYVIDSYTASEYVGCY